MVVIELFVCSFMHSCIHLFFLLLMCIIVTVIVFTMVVVIVFVIVIVIVTGIGIGTVLLCYYCHFRDYSCDELLRSLVG